MNWLGKLCHQARRAVFRQVAAPVACSTGKRAFGCRREARRALALWRGNGIDVHRAYKCAECRCWHLTSRRARMSAAKLALALSCVLVLAGPAGRPQAQALGTQARPTYAVLDSEQRDSLACAANFAPLPQGGYLVTFAPCEVLFRSGFE